MTTHVRLRWAAAVLVLASITLLGGAHLCGVALDKASDPGMRPIGVGGLACTEFWLNRYQTLVGAIAAVGAAALAWRGAMMQVAIGRRQSAIALIDVLNKQTADVEMLANWVERTARYGKIALIQRSIAIKCLQRMVASWEEAETLSKIYNDQFERSMKGHSSSLEALRSGAANVQEYISKALISTATKVEIEEFLMIARHLITTEYLAEETFRQVINIFDLKQNQRQDAIQALLDEAEGLVITFNLSEHSGVIAARMSAYHMAKLLDNALREAEGR